MFKKFKWIILVIFTVLVGVSIFLITKVNVSYDMTSFLPSESKTQQALKILEEEFEKNGYFQVMVEDIKLDDALVLKEQLQIENVLNIDYEYKDNSILFKVSLLEDDYSISSTNVIKEYISILNNQDYNYYMNGQTFQSYNYNEMLNEEIPKIIIMLVPLILIILFLTTTSFIEPLIFVIVVLVSIALNMGTNAFLPSISYMTHSIASILQFAICMDYSIILLHRYQDCKKTLNKEEALKKAWKTSIIPILASSFTTVAGFIAIMFMKYRIGFDIGIVLAKGVVITLITVIVLMPVLILVFDKLLEKTKHKSFIKKSINFDKFIFKTRYILPIIVLLIIACGAFFQTKNKFVYSDNTFSNSSLEMSKNNEKISSTFGYRAPVLVLVNKDVDTNLLIDKLESATYNNKTYITSSISFEKELSFDEANAQFTSYGISSEEFLSLYSLINMKYQTFSLKNVSLYFDEVKKISTKMSLDELSDYINSNFYQVDKNMLGLIYQLQKQELLSLEEIIYIVDNEYSLEEMVYLLDGVFQKEEIENCYLNYNVEKMKLTTLINYYNELFSSKFDFNSLSYMLADSISGESLALLFNTLGDDALSIKEISDFGNLLFTFQEMKEIFSGFDENTIRYVYSVMKEASLLENDKTSINNFILFLDENFYSSMSVPHQELLNNFKIEIAKINELNSRILYLEEMNNLLSLFSSSHLESLKNYSSIDVSTIKNQFESENYKRVILTINLAEESELSFAYYEEILKVLEENTFEYYITSQTSAVLDIKDISKNDYLITTIISVILVFIIIMITFKSIFIPLLLVILIEGAIFINMAIPAILGNDLYYIGYLIVGCIQLGATIDYGILLANKYMLYRKEYPRKESMYNAIREAVPSILTSGIILAACGLSLGIFSSIPVISSLGRLIGIGALVSMALVLVALPQTLYISDKLIDKLTIKNEFKKND